jgi:hypothetical protein
MDNSGLVYSTPTREEAEPPAPPWASARAAAAVTLRRISVAVASDLDLVTRSWLGRLRDVAVQSRD